VVSTQVLREIVLQYTAWRVVAVDVPLLAAAMERNERDVIAWWDALVVESALRAGAIRIATEDLQHGRIFDGTLQVWDPLAA
jgi:predicted nucleic acid-binding protein